MVKKRNVLYKLESIQDEETLFLNKTPQELLKELRMNEKNVKVSFSKKDFKSQDFENQISELVDRNDSDNEDFMEQGLDDNIDEEDNPSSCSSDNDSDILKMDPRKQLKMLEEPIHGDDDQEEFDNYEDDKSEESRKQLFDSEDQDSEEKEMEASMSTYQRQKEIISKQARSFEQENTGEASWLLKGEISSKARPENSLLEEDLEFDFQSMPPPVITEKVSESIEDVIKRRIKEGVFDNPEIPISQELKDKAALLKERRKEISLEMEGREDLGQVYEKEFLKSKENNNDVSMDGVDPKLQEKYKELDGLYKKIIFNIDQMLYKSLKI